MTENLQKIANQFAKGRLISCMEGGYGVKMGPISPLAQSVSAHVRALVNTHTGPLFTQEGASFMEYQAAQSLN